MTAEFAIHYQDSCDRWIIEELSKDSVIELIDKVTSHHRFGNIRFVCPYLSSYKQRNFSLLQMPYYTGEQFTKMIFDYCRMHDLEDYLRARINAKEDK